MTAATIGIDGALAALQMASGESPLRAWMERHYEELVRSQNGRRLRWPALCDWFGSVGLTNARGENPTIKCAQITWYRVGVWLKKRRAQADATDAARLAREQQDAIDREAALEAARERRRVAEQDQAERKRRGEQVQYEAALARDDRQRIERESAQLVEQKRGREAAQVERDAASAAELAAALTADGVEMVTLDLPRIPGVSSRAYEPFDPRLPPCRKGERHPVAGYRWEYGDDLPGYPSKRGYEFEADWVRDVGLLLWHKHQSILSLPPAERNIVRAAKSRFRHLF